MHKQTKNRDDSHPPITTQHKSNIEYNPFHIGNVRIPNPLILAPLAGITDTVFRTIIKDMGAGLVTTEMISCHALHYDSKKTWKIAEFTPGQLPVAAQIFGDEPQYMAEAAKKLQDLGISIIDINLGCSVPKVVKGGGGAGLPRNMKQCAEVIEKTVQAVTIPVTLKMRIGWSREEITAPKICRIAEETGVAAVTIHGRTSSQRFSGTADWDFIKTIKETTRIPVIGNGDIRTPEDARKRLHESGCEAVMIGRESYANPRIFREALNLLQGKSEEPAPNTNHIRDLMLQHLEESVLRYGEENGVERMRKFVAWYTKGLRGSARFREKVFTLKTHADTVRMIENFFAELPREEISPKRETTDDIRQEAI